MPKPSNPIPALLRLGNEWRDTASYLVFTAYTAQQVSKADNICVPLTTALTTVYAREAIRCFAWSIHDDLQYAGHQTQRVNSTQFMAAAATITCASIATRAILGNIGGPATHANFPEAIPLTLAGTALFLCLAHGPAAIAKAYGTMWDWPRQKGGGGITQTQRLKTACAKLLRKNRGGLSPVRTAFTPMQDAHHTLTIAA